MKNLIVALFAVAALSIVSCDDAKKKAEAAAAQAKADSITAVAKADSIAAVEKTKADSIATAAAKVDTSKKTTEEVKKPIK
ncbi:MAG: hypothetical protein H7Y04_14795 [Verrucomicrobia bacterium]|nr:hypothetical protein [Cytophagales bacterium]